MFGAIPAEWLEARWWSVMAPGLRPSSLWASASTAKTAPEGQSVVSNGSISWAQSVAIVSTKPIVALAFTPLR